MDFFLVHMLDMVLALLTPETLFVLILLLSATTVLNSVTEADAYSRMTANFLSLAAGAFLSWSCLPDLSPPLAQDAQILFALFSGMTVAALVNIALLKPA